MLRNGNVEAYTNDNIFFKAFVIFVRISLHNCHILFSPMMFEGPIP